MGQLTSSQMDMTSTMGTARAALSWSNPPTSAKRSRSPKALNWAVQNSGVMELLSFGMPSKVEAGISIFLPSWTKNWVSLFFWNWVTTLVRCTSRVSAALHIIPFWAGQGPSG